MEKDKSSNVVGGSNFFTDLFPLLNYRCCCSRCCRLATYRANGTQFSAWCMDGVQVEDDASESCNFVLEFPAEFHIRSHFQWNYCWAHVSTRSIGKCYRRIVVVLHERDTTEPRTRQVIRLFSGRTFTGNGEERRGVEKTKDFLQQQ